jgi:hypothetical protein
VIAMSLVTETFKYSDTIKNNRDAFYVLSKCVEELGELSVEVQIATGVSYKEAGKDGVVGEAIDLITCVLDLIRITHPNLSEEDLVAIAIPKLEKWKAKATIDIGRSK